MNNTPRLSAILPLKITVGSEPHIHLTHTLDISLSGAKVILPLALQSGSTVVLEYRKNRAKAVVIWSKPVKRNSSDHVTGIRLLDDGQRFWLVDLGAKAQIVESAGQCDTMRLPKRSERSAI